MDIEQIKELLLSTKEEIINFKNEVKEREVKQILNCYLNDIDNDLNAISKMERTRTLNTQKLSEMKEKYLRVYHIITGKDYVIPSKDIAKEQSIVKVETIISEENQTDKQKEEVKKGVSVWKERFKGALIVAAIVGVIILTKDAILKNKNSEKEIEDTKEKIEIIDETKVLEPANEAAEEIILIQKIDDDQELYNYAKYLVVKYGLEYKPEEIYNMIKLANFDIIKDNAGFKNRNNVLNISQNIGNALNVVPSNELIIEDENTDIYILPEQLNDILKNVTDNTIKADDFKDALTNKGYSIYKVYEICIKNLNNENNTLAFNYAKILNDILARFTLDFSICHNAPIGSYYTIFGMYNANKEKIAALTANKKLATIYGNGYQNDDTYGYICVEELMKYASFDNEQNAFYTFIIDENIINKEMTK